MTQQTQKVLVKIDTNRKTPGHIVLQMIKYKNRGSILKTFFSFHNKILCRFTAYISNEYPQVRRDVH